MEVLVFLLIMGGIIGLCVYYVKKKDQEDTEEWEREQAKKKRKQIDNEVLEIAALVPMWYAVIGESDLADEIDSDQQLFCSVMFALAPTFKKFNLDVVVGIAETITNQSWLSAVFMGGSIAVWHGEGEEPVTSEFWKIVNAAMQTTAIILKAEAGWDVADQVKRITANLIVSNKFEIECRVRKALNNPHDEQSYKWNASIMQATIADEEFREIIKSYHG